MLIIIGGGLGHYNPFTIVNQLLYVILYMIVQLQTALLSGLGSRLRVCEILAPWLFLGATLYAEGNMMGFVFVSRYWEQVYKMVSQDIFECAGYWVVSTYLVAPTV